MSRDPRGAAIAIARGVTSRSVALGLSWTIVVVAGAASCTTGGGARSPEARDAAWRTAAAARADELARRDAAATSAQEPAPVPRTLTEEVALQLALERRRELLAARASWDAARARAEGAGLFPNPSLIARVEEASLEGDTFDDAAILAGFSQPIPLSDRRGAERRSEEATAARERARY